MDEMDELEDVDPPPQTLVIACTINTPKKPPDIRTTEIDLRPDEFAKQLSRVTSTMRMSDPTVVSEIESDRSSSGEPIYGYDTMDTMTFSEPIEAMETAFERVHQLPAKGYVFIKDQ